MAKVFSNDMVAHVWAQQTQNEGRSHNGNSFFEGPAIYSYGRHFVVGYIMPDGTALLNRDTYSISTSRHQSEARGAVRHRTCFTLPGLTNLVVNSWSAIRLLLSSDASDTKRGRALLDTYIRANATSLPADAARYLLTIAGHKDTGIRHMRLCKAAERDAMAERAKQARETRDRNLARAKRAADMAPDTLAAWIAERKSDRWSGLRAMECQAKDLHHAHKAAKAAKRTKQAAAVWTMLKTIRGAIADVKRAAEIRERNAYGRNTVIPLLRDRAKRHAEGTLTASYDFQTWAPAANFAAEHFKGLSAETRDRLRQTADEASGRHQALLASENAAYEARKREESARRFQAETDRREAWLAGASNYWRGTDAESGALLRVRGDVLETSQGASVPLAHAIKVFRFVKLCRDKGAAWHRNGHTIRVGHFHVDAIDENGNFRAGCHVINWPECERVAKAIGAYDQTASADALEPSHAVA